MKKIFVIIVALLALVSCNMDFYSSDSMTSSQLADNPSSAVYTTDGLYTLLKERIAYKGQSGGESGNYYIRHYFQFAELRGDNITVSGKSEDPFTEAYMYSEDPTHKNIYYTWWMAYKIINAANSNIASIKPGDTALSDHLLGENYFFRAMMHFHMVTLFAMPYAQGRDNPGVPLRVGIDASTTTRATVGEVYDQIVEDLKSAKTYLANGEDERIKSGSKVYVSLDAARALLSRVYLYMGMNDECIAECNELMDHAPSSVTSGYDYADYPTHTYDHPETIWCLRLDNNDDWAGEHAEASIASMYIKDGNGWGEHYMSDILMDNFLRYPQDKRFTSYIGFTTANLSYPVAMASGKVTVVFPIRVNDKTNARSDAFAFDCTVNGDGSVDFTYQSKNYKAVPTTVNTYTEYYVQDASFPGEKLDGKARVFIRPNTNRSAGVRNNMGGDYLIYYSSKFSYQDGLPMMTSPVFLRWGEVVLNRAEAYAKKGGMDAQAIADVKLIRDRAGLTGDAEMTLANYASRGYATVLDLVLDERRKELCYEGHRAFDVFRNKLPMDRRFVGCHDWEILQPNDPRIAMLIPLDEINTSGIAQNKR